MYLPDHFRIEELVPPELFTRWERDRQRLFLLFDIVALKTLEALRSRYGPVVINNWHQGGSFLNSGWRPWDYTEGAPLSQHKLGRAFDCKFTRVSAEEVRQDLTTMPDNAAFSGIRRIEAFDGMSWFHFDTGNHQREEYGILTVGAPRKTSSVASAGDPASYKQKQTVQEVQRA